MTTYTFSFYAKVGDKWTRFNRTVDQRPDLVDWLEMARQMVAGYGVSVIGNDTLQLEEGNPAIQYVQRKHKGKNTNAWKPKRYGA